MRRSLIIVFIILLVAVAYFIMSGNQITYLGTDSITAISPLVKEYTQVSKLYFIHNNQLVSEMRTLNIEMLEVEQSALKALKKGPKIESYSSPIGEDVDIISVSTNDRICYVNLSSAFVVDDEVEMELYVTAVINTLAEFESIDYVQILVDGKKIPHSESAFDSPLPKNTTLVEETELTHKDIMKKFLNFIVQGRYDLAFDIIDKNSKSNATFRDFRESAAALRNEIDGYTQTFIFVERQQGRYVLYIKYVLRDSPSQNDLLNELNVTQERTYSWPMIQEDGLWKVQYFNY